MTLPLSVHRVRWCAPALLLILVSCGGDSTGEATTAENDASAEAAGAPGLDGGKPEAADGTSAPLDAPTADVSSTGDAPSLPEASIPDAATSTDAEASTAPDATTTNDAASIADASADTSMPVDASAIDAGADAQSTAAAIVKTGQVGQLLLRGMIVTPDTSFAGEVLIEGNTITCAAASCASSLAAATATIVETHGIIAPGMIDTHNHVLFDIFDETDWSPAQIYANHTQWVNEPKYTAMLDAKQYLNGEGASPLDLGCEMDKYGEMKGLVAGTTSIVGSAGTAKSCFGSLARSIDTSSNDLGVDKVQVSTLFPPLTSSADGVCNNFASLKTSAYLIHVGDGITTDTTAASEFSKLNTVTTVDGCLLAPQTTVVQGIALGDAEFTVMATHSMSLTWSPRSNVFVYGGGTDLSKTANVPLALSKGINVSIGPDWSLGGSQNMLDELRFADQVDNAQWGNILSAQMLVKMATTHPAKALGLDATIGSIAVGKRADLFVIAGDASDPFGAILKATPRDVRLTLVDGVALYGDAGLKALGPAAPGCEDMTICTAAKFACIAETGGTATTKLGQTFAEISSILSQAITDYDGLNLSQWKFAPITPVVRCP